MYGAAIDVGVGLIAQYGLLALLIVFALEGALVGKLIPTRTLFVATVLALGSDTVGIVSVVLVAVAGATLGQIALFVSVRRTELTLESLPGSSRADAPGRADLWFDRWGVPAVAFSNALPVTRGSLTVPAAITGTDTLRFSASSVVGTSVYSVGLVGIAVGIDAAVGLS